MKRFIYNSAALPNPLYGERPMLKDMLCVNSKKKVNDTKSMIEFQNLRFKSLNMI